MTSNNVSASHSGLFHYWRKPIVNLIVSVLTNADKEASSQSLMRTNTLQSLYSEQIKIKMSLNKKKKAPESGLIIINGKKQFS